MPDSNPSVRNAAYAGGDTPSANVAATVMFRPGIKVVVAEDDRVSQAVLTMILQKFGLEVHVACDGRKAVDLVREVRPDLILMDMQMPIMDGVDAIRMLRADADAPQPPVIVLSANNISAAMSGTLTGMGVVDFLLKPVNRTRLTTVLGQLLPKA